MSMQELIEDLRDNLKLIREKDATLSHADARLCSEAWRWARIDKVQDTGGNLASVRFYASHAARIAGMIAASPANR